MAVDNDEDDTEAGQEEAPAWTRKKWLWLIGLTVLLVIVSVAGTLLAMRYLQAESDTAALQEGETVGPVKPGPAIYYPLKPAVVVDFSVRGRQRFLQAELTLMTREDDVVAAIELHQPMLRNALVLLMGGQAYEELQTAEGKELLRQACLQTLQKLMQTEIGKPGIEQVLFTSFVMQ